MSNEEIAIATLAPSNQDERYDQLAAQFAALAADVHALKGNLAANTSITRDVADNQDLIKALLAKINVEKIIELVDAVDSMRGGIKVLGWLERPAKWVAAIGAAGAVLYSLWNHK